MKLDYPKVIFKIGGVPILRHLLANVVNVCEVPTIVVGHNGEKVIEAIGKNYDYVWQEEQLGTGHAVAIVKSKLNKKGDIKNIIVLPGDHPFISFQTLAKLLQTHIHENTVLSLATLAVPNFNDRYSAFYNNGRIIRDENGGVSEIVEVKNAKPEQLFIQEVNVSYYCFSADWLWENIGRLQKREITGEYYLTDMVKIAKDQNQRLSSVTITNPFEGMGVNTLQDSIILEDYLHNAIPKLSMG